MPTPIEIRNMTDADLQPIRVLLAESDPTESDRLKANVDRVFQSGIKIVKTYDQLVGSVTIERPHVVILGKIDRSSYSEIAHACHQILPDLPIVLLSSQGIIIDSFRQLVKTCGLTEVITRDSMDLDRLLQTIATTVRSQSQTQRLGTPTAQPSRQHLVTEPLGKPLTATIPPPPSALGQRAIAGHIMLAALAEIVKVSNNYFGPLAQGNYWRKAHTRIVNEFPFVANWSADHFSKIDCTESVLDRELTAEDIQSLRIWVGLFIEECERIIIDYRSILQNSDLSPPAQDLLTTTS
ncbi:hypothetical protein [Chamaesiphon sp.]|uniref:hypothetical protein n=1 Tax=Chamaesiphon sp. TaxID=2814140 RepID=UPI0035942D4F